MPTNFSGDDNAFKKILETCQAGLEPTNPLQQKARSIQLHRWYISIVDGGRKNVKKAEKTW
jgi:hypothetical protein